MRFGGLLLFAVFLAWIGCGHEQTGPAASVARLHGGGEGGGSAAPPPIPVVVTVTLRLNPTYRIGEEIPVTIVVTNSGRTPIELPDVMHAPRHWLDVILVGPDGREVTWNAYPPLVRGWGHKTVAPDEFDEDLVDLNRVFLIEKLGTYRAKAIFGDAPIGERSYSLVESAFYQFEITKR